MLSFLKKKESKPSGLTCISRNTNGISIAYAVLKEDSSVDFTYCAFLPCQTPEQQISALTEYVNTNGLEGTDCACVLSTADYRLLLLDAPNVPQEELKRATHWLVKDLVEFPVDEMAIDIFNVPVREGQPSKIYVVTTQLSALQEIVALAETAELNPRHIDIMEFSIRNTMLSIKDSNSCIATLFLGTESAHILILLDGVICLARNLGSNFPLTGQNSAAPIKNMSLSAITTSSSKYDSLIKELQRSFNFYQNQTGGAPPAKLFLTPTLMEQADLATQLQTNLKIPIEKLGIEQSVVEKNGLSVEQQTYCLPVVGEGMGFDEIFSSE